MGSSAFFRDVLGAELRNERWSWGAQNPQTGQVFLKVWADQRETTDGVDRIRVLRPRRESHESAGYNEQVAHLAAISSGAPGYGVVCTAKEPGSGRASIKSFDADNLLRFGRLIDEGNSNIYAEVLGTISTEDIPRDAVPDVDAVDYRQPPQLESTEKVTLRLARIGQGLFRQMVLGAWGQRCCVTGSTTCSAIRASHIKPWRDCDDEERLDPHNGLPLVATLDALFDVGLIAFDGAGQMLVSPALPTDEVQTLGLEDLRLRRPPTHQAASYLAHHREHQFIAQRSV